MKADINSKVDINSKATYLFINKFLEMYSQVVFIMAF